MLEFKYALRGGNLTSIRVDGIEKLYQPDPKSWKGQDIVIFPFVARLKEKSYTVDGKNYSMLNHGLARYADFKLIDDSGNKVVLEYISNEESKKQYPFSFVLTVIYEAKDNQLKVTYTVTNSGDSDMPFGLGAHPALKVDAVEKEEECDISGNQVVFEKELDVSYYEMDDKGEFVLGKKRLGKIKSIPLSKEFFRKWNTLILDVPDLHDLKLVKKSGEMVTYHFDHIHYLTLWSHPYFGDYVCIEPWMSLPDFVDAPKELKKKKTLLSLKPKETYCFSYSLQF